MSEGVNGSGALEDSVVRILEHQSKYGIDQDTMLIYLSSVNLMSILNLLNRRYGSAGYAPASLPLPPLVAGASPSEGQPMENMLGMLLKMLGSQSGGDSTGGQGINPATMLNLLANLSQNIDLGKMMGMLSALMAPADKPAASQQKTAGPPSGSELTVAKPGSKEIDKNSGEERGERREVPKIMKWDQFESAKK